MAKRTGAPEPSIAELQLTLAKAQLAMAEALRAMVGAQQESASPETSEERFIHSGTLELDDDPNNVSGLVLVEDGTNERMSLEELANRGKWVRLELKLEPEDVVVAALGVSPPNRLARLGDFLRRRAAGIGPMGAQCPWQVPTP